LRVVNNANQPVTAELVTRIAPARGEALLDERKVLECPARGVLTLTWTANPATPDFYTASWSLNLKGTPKTAEFTFGYDVTAIKPTVETPADFTAYWDRVAADAAAAKVSLTRLEEASRSTGTVMVYRIAVAAAGETSLGWLSVPKFPGRYPGLLLLPGDRARYITPNASLADCGFVVMTIEPTGQTTVDSALHTLITRASVNFNDPARFGLRAVMIRDLRALSALATVPEVDPNRLAVSGVGLGGGLALILGAVDDRVQAVAADVPFYCQIELNRAGRNWPYWEVDSYLRTHPTEEQAVLQTLRYYDAANFAPRITCPVLVSAGIEDAYSRPNTIYGVYNRLVGPKAIKLYPGGHDGGGYKHWEEKIRWLGQVLGRPAPLPAAADGAP